MQKLPAIHLQLTVPPLLPYHVHSHCINKQRLLASIATQRVFA